MPRYLPLALPLALAAVSAVPAQPERFEGRRPPADNPGSSPMPKKGPVFAAAAGEGGGPLVRVFYSTQPDDNYNVYAYDAEFRGGVRVAVGDVTGDRAADVVVAPGPGSLSRVRVFDGRTLRPAAEWDAYGPRFAGGVFVAVAPFTGRERADVITGPGEGGGPHVAIFDGRTGGKVTEFNAFDPDDRSGVRVGVSDVNDDGVADAVAAPGAGSPPIVRVFDGSTWRVLTEFSAFGPEFRGGVYVSTR